MIFIFPAKSLTAQGSGNLFCGEIVKTTSFMSGDTAFYDRFGNAYSEDELDVSSYPDDVFLEDCNSGIFTIQFGVAGSAPDWTADEMETVCEVFLYLSGLVTSGTVASGIVVRITKDTGCPSAAAATPVWDSGCGVANSVIFDQIALGVNNYSYPQGFISGIVCMHPAVNWHTLADDCSPTDPCMGENAVDLYTAILHEGLHVLGFASRIGLSGAPLTGEFYSRWDKFLHSTNQDAYLINPQSSTDCCDHHLFNAQDFPSMPTNLSGDCSMNVFFFDGSANVAEVNNDAISPSLDGQMANKLSHLDNDCTSGANFVMNPELPAETTNRTLSAPELAILCDLGYTGGSCGSSCVIVANNDGPYTLILSESTSITISASLLLNNDAYPQDITVASCGNDPDITVTLNNDVFTVEGSETGVFTFCYTVSGCQGWCDEAEVRVIVRQEAIPLDCEDDQDCDLVSFGDFEGIEPIFNSYYDQLGLPVAIFNNVIPNGQPDPVQEIDNGGNIVVITNWSNILVDDSREIITIPLCNPIEPGCTATINFDAVSRIMSGDPANPTIQVYGLTGYPCPEIDVPYCATDPFPICDGVTGYCLTSTSCPNGEFGCTLPIDPDAIIFTGNATAQNLDLVHLSLTWENTSNQDITHLIFFTNTESGTLPFGARIFVPIDNVEVFTNCNSDITIEFDPNPLYLCIDGPANGTNVTVQLGGDGSQPVEIDLEAGPLLPGLSFSGGDFDANGQAQVTLTPNGAPETLILSLQAGPNWTPGTIVNVPVSASATSGSYCFNPNQGDNILQVVLEDCDEIVCECETGYNLTGTTTLSTSALPQNGLSNDCLAIAGTLTVDDEVPNASYTIEASTIRMQPGSSIIVNPGVTLNITGGNILGCEQLWKSIIVHGTLNLLGVTVEDAEYAVRLKSGAKVALIGNTFRKNYTSVYFNEFPTWVLPVFTAFHSNEIHCENMNLLPPYPGQQTPSGNVSYAAVDLNSMTGVNIGDGIANNLNHFHHLQNGILLHGCVVKVRSTKFSNIPLNTEYALRGHGIYTVRSTLVQGGLGLDPGNPTFQNVDRGIWATTSSNIDARSSTYRKVKTGIRVSHSPSIRIQQNLIYCDNVGIDLYQNQSAYSLNCLNNEIRVDYESGDLPGKGIGISVNDLPLDASTTLKNIRSNTIYTYGNNVGIRINAATRYKIEDNTVNLTNLIATHGFSISGTKDCVINCNDVYGAGTGGSSSPAYTGNTAYNISLTTGTTYRCNTSASVRSGFRFYGYCGSSPDYAVHFGGNTFNTAHRYGLWMTNTASFGNFSSDGTQVHTGNQWYGTYTGGYRAWHQGDPFLVFYSRFIVHTTSLPWYPQGLDPEEDWFDTNPGFPFSCFPTAECPMPSWITGEGDEIGEFGLRVAGDSLELPELYAGGLRWEMRQALYSKIAATPDIAEQDDVLDDFYQQNQNNALGSFTRIALDMAAVAEMADSTLIDQDAEIAAKLDTLVLLEQELPENPTIGRLDSLGAQKQAIGSDITTLHLARIGLLAGLQNSVNDTAAILVVVNNSIATTAIEEENRQKVNMVALNKVVRGSEQFTGIERQVLQDVAEQCPLTGGNAVYEARSILAYTGEILEFNDSLLCDSTILAEERGILPPAPQFHSGEEGYRFSAVPNPANDYLNIRYTVPQDATNLTVQLFSTTGMKAAEERLAGTEGTQQIDLSRLSAGLYYLRLISNGKLISVQKIVVVH